MRCGSALGDLRVEVHGRPGRSSILRRAIICVVVCLLAVLSFYLSLIATSKSLNFDQRTKVGAAIDVLEVQGFASEVVLLRRFAAFRSSDNWFNAMVPKENAFAATNFPFAIMTLYTDFFTYPIDDTERAAILLHEARHLSGGDEKDAYSFVWKNRAKLGWTREKYTSSTVWKNVRDQTREYSPEIFACQDKEFGDCTEP